MQGQSSPVQVKDPYTGSILMHVGSSCKTHRSVQCTPPKNNKKLINGSNKKTKQDSLMGDEVLRYDVTIYDSVDVCSSVRTSELLEVDRFLI